MARFDISVASAEEMRLIAKWAAAEGWNPGEGDDEVFFPTDPQGFLVGRLDGRPITSISAVRYGTGHGFIGLYITVPQWRGHGYGLRTWQAGIQRLAGRNIGLDGVVAQQANYQREGFREAWRTTRFQGLPAGARQAAGVETVDARSIGFAELAAFDRRFFPAERDAFLALWITVPGRRAVAARRNGSVVGFAVRRPAGAVDRIGPLFADSPEVAESLLAALSAGDRHGAAPPVMIDVPASNAPAVQLAERVGLAAAWDTARMYTGGVPQIDQEGIYAVTTLELG
ncbi:GNAT family N-acetyltransferase [Actinoplanes sp. NEAU-A12]|uniref:GNAT family N-acetyltransferase n=1 Tax=Actinoplanes sandaracinus TaxID=3045177 RepID=A0ABT6X106_9ACTN|nr:GNAT family N-acetyltransferase [Actinoplanes sandaracinus]MDI6105531.1 GNAT family N-acetyltransferase [Actinoplanes sandaracinus]